MAENFTELLNKTILNCASIQDAIRKLFELATNNTIENCRNDFRNACTYKTPIPTAYWGYSDYQSENDKLIEKTCEAAILIAHALALPIKTGIDYYDLICCALPYTKDLYRLKFIYAEIIQNTKSEDIRDYYVDCLSALNRKIKVLNSQDFDNSVFDNIVNLSETQKAWNTLHKGCDAYMNPVKILNLTIEDDVLEVSIEGYRYGEAYMVTYKNVRFKFRGVRSYFRKERGTTEFPILYLSKYADSLCSSQDKTITFECGDALKIVAESIETISICENTEPLYDESNMSDM